MHTQQDETRDSIPLLLYDWRLLRCDQLATLLRMDVPAGAAVLEQLESEGVIQRMAGVSAAGISQPVYTLGRRGAAAAACSLGIDRRGLAPAVRRFSSSLLFLEHKLRINDVRLAFVVAARQDGRHCVLAWRYEREITDRLPHPSQPGVLLPVRPDGYLAYQADARRIDAFVEADLGTVTNQRWRTRVEAFVAYRLSGAFRRRYGRPSFRVLAVTTTRRRLLNLVHATEKAGGRSMFWFTTWDDLATHSPLSPIWSVAGSAAASPSRGKRPSASAAVERGDSAVDTPRGAA